MCALRGGELIARDFTRLLDVVPQAVVGAHGAEVLRELRAASDGAEGACPSARRSRETVHRATVLAAGGAAGVHDGVPRAIWVGVAVNLS